MEMNTFTKYCVYNDHFEFNSIKALSTKDISDMYWSGDNLCENLVGKYDTLEEAIEIFKKESASCFTHRNGKMIFGNIVFIEINEYDEEDDERVCGGDWYDYYAQPVKGLFDEEVAE